MKFVEFLNFFIIKNKDFIVTVKEFNGLINIKRKISEFVEKLNDEKELLAPLMKIRSFLEEKNSLKISINKLDKKSKKLIKDQFDWNSLNKTHFLNFVLLYDWNDMKKFVNDLKILGKKVKQKSRLKKQRSSLREENNDLVNLGT